jgi:metallophosphoesterase (TIGR00282 family)
MSTIKIIFIGDIVGQIGRKTVSKLLPKLKKKFQPDIIIANAENLAHGKGVTKKTIQEMTEAGINFFTSGNHVWKTRDAKEILNESSFIIRPANYPPGVPGAGYSNIKINNINFYIINLMGRVFMKEDLDCPFRKADEILKKIQKQEDGIIIVDFHAEATSEKIALKYYLDGRVNALLGTHTHIATADEQITKKGTAYITDVGGVLAKDSIIGVDKEGIIKTFLTQINETHEIANQGIGVLDCVYIEIDKKNNKAIKIKRVQQETKII